MEAVGAFIEGCKKYGLTEKDCCVTLDIYEKLSGDQNMVSEEGGREKEGEGGERERWHTHTQGKERERESTHARAIEKRLRHGTMIIVVPKTNLAQIDHN